MKKISLILSTCRPVFVTLVLLFTSSAADAILFVGSSANGTISTYTNSGALINPALISSLGFVRDIAVSGNNLYILSQPTVINAPFQIGVYTTSGRTINSSLITGLPALSSPDAIAVSGNNIFVGSNVNHGTVSQYTTSGTLVNPSLITGLQPSFTQSLVGDMAISGDKLFVTSFGSSNGLQFGSKVGEYMLNGAPVDANLITFTQAIATALTISGSNLYVRNSLGPNEAVGEDSFALYTTTGTLVDPEFITGITDPSAIAITDQAIFVGNGAIITGTLGKFTLSGDLVDPEIVKNLGIVSLAVGGPVAGVPDSVSTFWLALPLIGVFAVAGFRRKNERQVFASRRFARDFHRSLLGSAGNLRK